MDKPTSSSGTSVVATGALLVACTYGLARFGYGLTLPGMRADLDLSGAAAGAIGAGSFAAYCVAAALAGAAVRRGHARGTAAAAGLSAAVGAGVVALAPSPGTLAVGVPLAGSGAGLASPALVALLAERLAAGRLDRAQAVANAGTGLGVLIAGPALLALGGDWRVAWAGVAALSGGATVAILWTTCRPRPDARPLGLHDAAAAVARGPAPGSAPLASAATTAAVGPLGPAVAAALLAGAGSAAVWTFGLDAVTTEGGLSPAASTLFWTLLGAAGLAGAASGDLARRLGVRSAWAALAVAVGVATVGLGLAPGALALALVCGALFGGAYTALSGVLIAWATRLRPEGPAGATAVLFVALAAGQAAGSVGLGVLTDLAGREAAFVVAACLCVLGAAAGPPRPHRTAAPGRRPPPATLAA